MVYLNARFLTQQISGVQRHAIEVSKIIRRQRPDFKFIAPRRIIHRELADIFQPESCGRLTGHLWEQLELPRYLKRRGEPLLVCMANTAPVRYRSKIVTIHDIGFLRYPRNYSRAFYYWYKFLIPRQIRTARRVVTGSVFARNELAGQYGLDAENIPVIYNGVAESILERRDNTYPNRHGRYILAVSSLAPSKNFRRIIQAFRKVNPPDCRLVIAGFHHRNFGETGLNELIENDSRIILTGHLSDDDLVGLYKNAELFVFPSIYEGFGLPPLEAMACGCPVISSTAASLPEVCGEAALYCDPFSVDDIAEKIKLLIGNDELKKEMIARGLNQADKFTWEKVAERLLEVIEEHVDEKTRAS